MICNRCNKEYIYSRKSGGTTKFCASCVTSIRRKKLKEKAILYKGGKCSICGYDKCNTALEFHHTDPSNKEIEISCNKNPSWDKLKIELDKCVILCANCHRELHEEMARSSRG